MKKTLAFLLALTLCIGMLAGCAGEKGSAKDPAPQKTVKDDGVMKILLIGHSLGIDSSCMFPDVARNEGMENLVVGVLYHSGCRVVQHVDYLTENAAQYAYYEYDISKDNQWYRADRNGNFLPYAPGDANDKYIEDGTIAQTMQFAIQRQDWDMVILQANWFEAANVKDDYYTRNNKELNLTGYIQQLMDYVKENDIEKGTPIKFSWNMIWSCPADDSVLQESTKTLLYENFENSTDMYAGIAKVTEEEVAPAFDWEYILPVGTTIENLKSTKLQNQDIYRDYAHATDFGRLAAAYTWYCTITGTDIHDCKLDPIPAPVLLDNYLRNTGASYDLTEEQRNMLIEAVDNAIKTPYAMTQSQYTG